MNYIDFINQKKPKFESVGFTIQEEWLNPNLFPYQKEIVKRACQKGRYALFVDTGLGKSLMQLNFAYAVSQYTNKPVLVLAPLAVVFQMLKEASKFGIPLHKITDFNDSFKRGIHITNYDQLEKLDTETFAGIVLDESSILKSLNGSTKKLLIEKFQNTPYKLACSATPSPNDFMELGNHSEFLGVASRNEMTARYFINDTFNTGEWRLKKHAKSEFWEWVGSFAECISSPSDLGYDASSHQLPPLKEHICKVAFDDCKYLNEGSLFSFNEQNATTLARNKKESLDLRLQKIISIIETIQNEPILIWTDTNLESESVTKALKNKFSNKVIEELKGSDTPDKKANTLNAFAEGRIDIFITKASIAGMGMNFQNANQMIFLGLNYSYESYYQSIRRMWRFGQKKEVNVFIILSDNEVGIWEVLQKKKAQHQEMKVSMTSAICSYKHNKQNQTIKNIAFDIPSFLRSNPYENIA